MTKDEIEARLADVIAELDRKREHLLRAGAPKAMVPILLCIGILACSEALGGAGSVGDDLGGAGGIGGHGGG